MPTARELLEQADALMRRNRTDDSEPDIPELTDEVAVAGTVLPVRASSKESPDAGERRRGQGGGRSLPEPDNADVEGPSIQTPQEHEGEDSRWLDADLGEASVTGPAPDSIAVVPPSTLRSPRGAGRTEASLPPLTGGAQSRATDLPVDMEIPAPNVYVALSRESAETPPASDPGFEAMLGVKTVGQAVAPGPLTQAAPATPDDAAPPEQFAAAFEATPAPVASPPLPAPIEASASEPFTGAVFDWEAAPDAMVPAPAPEETRIPEPLAAPVVESESVAVPVESPSVHDETVVQETQVAHEDSTVDHPVEASVPDAERWEGLAEEIRMQVLQRIDIFTDTGLHGELSARLQPIVDRASVDLVTTINREVGQILRAYVAEAIEREIEKWREANP